MNKKWIKFASSLFPAHSHSLYDQGKGVRLLQTLVMLVGGVVYFFNRKAERSLERENAEAMAASVAETDGEESA